MAPTRRKLLGILGVLCVLLSVACGQQPPILRQYPRDSTLETLERNSTFIACYIQEGGTGTTVAWYKAKGSVQVAAGEELRFPSAKLEDSAKYKCVMSNSDGRVEQEFDVKVYGLHVSYGFVGFPSRIKSTQTKQQIMKWYDAIYMKGGLEDKTSEILSYFTSLNLKKSGYDYDEATADLLIRNTALHHEGNYTLTANNFIITTWSFNRFHVYVRPTQAFIEGFPDYVKESESMSVSCVVHRVKPANMTFSWFLGTNPIAARSHTEVSTENMDGTFKVTSTLTTGFLRRDDREQLQCQAVHGVDTTLQSQDQKQVFVYYEYQTKAVAKDLLSDAIEGRQKMLVCENVDEGKPTSTSYKWYKNDVQLPNNDKFQGLNTDELTIRNLASTDDGDYGCKIDNEAGNGIQKETFHLEVFYEPKVTLQGPTAVDEGEETTITCSVDAKPGFTSMVWYRDDTRLPTPNGDVADYKLLPASRSDRGRYRCEVTNKIGTSHQDHELDVRYKPTGQPSVSADKHVMLVSTNQTLTCNNNSLTDRGNPPYDGFVWTLNSKELPNKEATLGIAPTQVSPSASYACAATNEIGRSDFSQPATIVVEAPLHIHGNTSHTQHKPRFDDEDFVINYTVTGGAGLQMTLANSSTPVSQDDFTTTIDTIHGDFPFGQATATKVTYAWKLAGKDFSNCESITYFNGDYSFITSGTQAGVRTSITRVFRIAVQYPAMWMGGPRQNSSAMEMAKTLVCGICANPAPTNYEWTFENGNLPGGITQEDNKLNILKVGQQHFGTYQCHVATVIKGQTFEKTFNIELQERGSPHVPENLVTASRTSETLLITWSAGHNGGYDMIGFELQYRKVGESTWQTDSDTPKSCPEQLGVCEVRLSKLQPATNYSVRVRAKNERPVVLETDPYSDYVEIDTRTKALPPITFLPAEISEEYLKIRWVWKMEDIKSRRRRRDTSSDSSVGLKILYKQASETTFRRFPENENERVPVSEQRAVIPGQFDVTQHYDVHVAIYEGQHEIKAITPKLSTKPVAERQNTVAAGTATIAGIVVAVVLVLVIVVLVIVFLHKRRAAKGSDVELRRKAKLPDHLLIPSYTESPPSSSTLHVTSIAGYHPVTNAASTESLPYHPPMPTDPPPPIETPRPPMAQPLKPRAAPRTAPNGQPFKESPYVNVAASGDRKPLPAPDDNASLYENVKKPPQYENVSFRSRPNSPQEESGDRLYDEVSREQQQEIPNNQNTMIYTDVAFTPAPTIAPETSKVHIRGEENRVDYAQLDFTKMAAQQKPDTEV